MSFNLFHSYLSERYNDGDFAPLNIFKVAEMFPLIQHQNGIEIFEAPFGFMTFKLQGDAAILFDMYVKPEYRKQGCAWVLHNAFEKLAAKHGKRVMITFSEKVDKNKDLGLAAINAAGFEKVQEHTLGTMFLKGI